MEVDGVRGSQAGGEHYLFRTALANQSVFVFPVLCRSGIPAKVPPLLGNLERHFYFYREPPIVVCPLPPRRVRSYNDALEA